MPPGLSRENVKKRKASSTEPDEPESDELGAGIEREEQHAPELNISGRQRRTCAMKPHKVWDALKPGAKQHMEEDATETGGGGGCVTHQAKKARSSAKRRAQDQSPTGTGIEEHSKLSEQVADEQQQHQLSQTLKQEEQRKRIVITRKIVPANSRIVQHVQPQPAKNKDQLQLIEREMRQQYQFSDDSLPNNEEELSDEEEEDEEREGIQSSHVLLDDPNDEDFPDFPSRGGRRGRGESQRGRGGGRGSRGGAGGLAMVASLRGVSSSRSRPRGSKPPIGGGVMRVNAVRAPINFYQPARGAIINGTNSGIYTIQPTTGGIIGDLPPLRPPSVRIVRPRPTGIALHQPISSYRPQLIKQAPIITQYNEASFQINRELENYRNNIVAGSSVHQFNNIIDQLLQELSRVADDREKLIASHRDYVDHLQLTHAAAQEIKDNRIRQLEHSLDQMQHKLMTGFKQEQLQLVKTNSVSGVEGSSQEGGENVANGMGGELVKVEQQQQQQSDQQQHDIGRGGVGTATAASESAEGAVSFGQSPSMPSQMENVRPAVGGAGGAAPIRHLYPAVGAQNRMRIAGGDSGGLGLNSPYDDDDDPYEDLEDEDFEDDYDEGDSADIDDDLGAQVTI